MWRESIIIENSINHRTVEYSGSSFLLTFIDSYIFEMNRNKVHISIIGAGIAGLTAAIMLREQGFAVDLFEAGSHPKGIGAGMGLASNGMKAYDYLGLLKEVESIAYPLQSFTIADANNKKIFSISTTKLVDQFGVGNFSVHRADLHELLLGKLPESIVHTKKKLIELVQNKEFVELKFEDGYQIKTDYVIGADGISSVVRKSIFPEADPQYAGYWCWRGVVNKPSDAFKNSRALWGKKGRFGITPLTHNRIYWFACISTTLNGSVTKYGKNDLINHFKNYSPFVSRLLEETTQDLISGPIMDIVPLQHLTVNRVILIGDAAHSATPNMGQGACLAVEDVAVLQRELQKSNSFAVACKAYEKSRLNRVKYVIENSKRAGVIAQTKNPLLYNLRNSIFRILPNSVIEFPLKRLYTEDFMKL